MFTTMIQQKSNRKVSPTNLTIISRSVTHQVFSQWLTRWKSHRTLKTWLRFDIYVSSQKKKTLRLQISQGDTHSDFTRCVSASALTVTHTVWVSPDAQKVGTFRDLCELTNLTRWHSQESCPSDLTINSLSVTHIVFSQWLTRCESHRTLKMWVRFEIYVSSRMWKSHIDLTVS